MKKLVTITLLIFSFILSNAQPNSSQKEFESEVCRSWMMFKTVKNHKVVPTTHNNMFLTVMKNKRFIIEASYEKIIKGSWKYNATNDTLILTISEDSTTLKIHSVKTAIHQLVLEGYDNDPTKLYFHEVEKTPKHHLNTSEKKIARTWNSFLPDRKTAHQLVYEFHPDHTFIIYDIDDHKSTLTGDWSITKDQLLELIVTDETEIIEFEILNIDKHDVLINELNNKNKNLLYDNTYVMH